MLYAQIPPHLVVKAPRKASVEPSKPVPLVDDSVVRHANEKMNALLEMEEHYRRQTALNLDEHYRRTSEQNLLCFNTRCMLTTLDEAEQRFYSSRAVSSRWAENITDVRLGW